MEYTKHYHLPQWAESDLILMEDFNKAMANIDDGLEAVKTESAADRDTLADSMSSQFAAMGTAMAEAIGSGGKNCRVTWGSYKGTGTYGKDNPTSLELGFCPVALVMASAAQEYGSPAVLLKGMPRGDSTTSTYSVYPTWGDTGIQWYSHQSAAAQNNASGVTYYYAAIGYSK